MKIVDLHAHPLPGLDDGPADLAETVETLRCMHAGGTRTVVATPHMFFSPFGNDRPEAVREVFERTVAELERLGRRRREDAFLGEMTLLPGAENYLSTELLEALERGEVLALHDTRSLLVEFNPFLAFGFMKAAIGRLLQNGYRPVLAHVERYQTFQRDAGRLASLVDMGCAAQINGDSLLEGRASPMRRASFAFLESGLASVVASDAHNAGPRRSRLDEAARLLEKRYGRERTLAWLCGNPGRIAGVEVARETVG